MEQTLQKSQIIESPARDENMGFDMRTEIRDARTHKIVKVQHYVRHSDRERGVVYERDGKFYYENGQEAQGWGSSKETVSTKSEPVQSARK